jgi:predicted nucleotidyltransferase
MTYSDIERLLRDWAGPKPFIWRLCLFRSRARGDHRINSDVDVCVFKLIQCVPTFSLECC